MSIPSLALAAPTRRDFLSAGAGLAAGTCLACRAGSPPLDEPAAVEAFPELEDARASAEPIRPAERAARRERLAALLVREDLDALLVEPGATMSYLAGVSWGRSERLFALVVLADGAHFWVCPGFEVERAELSIEPSGDAAGPGGPIVAWQEHEYPFAPLAAELARRGARRVAIEPSLRHRFVAGLEPHVGPDALVSGADVVAELRGRKDEHELALLRRANELTQEAIVAASERLEPGMGEREIRALMRGAQEKLGLTDVWCLALVGESAAYPHGAPSPRPLERGDVVLVDTGGALHGYQSDNTRTWVFDAPVPARVERIWNVVRDAQRRAFEALRPGVRCREVDAAARAVIDAAGFGPGYRTFTHRLGHGIGMEGHEDPYFDGGSEVVLAPGMTLSDEPGIYLYGEFGVRIEDIVAITEDGADHFGSWQAGPESPRGTPAG